jgi:hypothetical protein
MPLKSENNIRSYYVLLFILNLRIIDPIIMIKYYRKNLSAIENKLHNIILYCTGWGKKETNFDG